MRSDTLPLPRFGTVSARVLTAALCLAMLSGCGIRERFFSGAVQEAAALPYDARLVRGDDRRNFVVTLKEPGVALFDARESLRFPATRYCIERYGGSHIDWVLDPETGDWATIAGSQTLAVSGRCITR